MLLVNTGAKAIVDKMVAIWQSGAPVAQIVLKVSLWLNNYTLVPGSLLSDLTNFSTIGGSPQVVNSFAATVITPGNQAFTVDVPHLLTGLGSGNNAHGWYVYDDTNNILLWGHTYPSPLPINAGDTITVTPSFLQQSIAAN
jgi:hypothetical protein